MEERVVLVNEKDEEIGTEEKMQAHKMGLLHRAFSVFIFNDKGEMLLQKRSLSKYHSGGLWTNTCCSHPRRKEPIEQAAHRRLKEEMGFDCPLIKLFSFIYRGILDKGLQEHEFDHVFYGKYSGMIHPNPLEVCDYRWISLPALLEEVERRPEEFTIWFRLAVHKVMVSLSNLREAI